MTYEEPKRARRIRDRERMIARGRRISSRWNDHPSGYPLWRREADGTEVYRHETWDDVYGDRDMYGRYNHDHLAKCSCSLCGNPRHGARYAAGLARLTFQERRALLDEHDQLADLLSDDC